MGQPEVWHILIAAVAGALALTSARVRAHE